MASTGRVARSRPLGAQLGALRSRYTAGRTSLGRGVVSWVGPIQPTPLSVTYTVKVSFQLGWRRPRVEVLDPPLRTPDSPRLPHVFPGDRLCLNFPEEWNANMLIADTVMPWASEWLLHYEWWKATGQWHGGGHEPPPTDTGD
jgi:hypothetical protein